MTMAMGLDQQDNMPPAPAPADSPVDIPYGYARDHGVLLARTDGSRVMVAMREDADPVALLEVRRYLSMPFDVEAVDAPAFAKLLADHYAAAGSFEDVPSNDIPGAECLPDSANEAAAIRLINGIIAEAARAGASDIHIEANETGLAVRMRVEGLLTEKLRMPSHVAPAIVDRIKAMAGLDIAEKKIPQDGCITFTLAGTGLDIRVSTLPNRDNERVVMRILDKKSAGVSLDLVGLSGETHQILSDALSEPNGIILVTGPGASGKTTTLYAALKQLNDGNRNILTVEDPVEYAIEGVGQTQVDAKAGLTFAAGLKALLRQDPDVVMVGEIRDRETANIAVQAALTGPLVLSTVHSNDAVGAISRMRDMKVEPFLLASTVRAVIAQRLVRRLCEHCRKPIQADGSLASLLGFDRGTVVFQATGCAHCDQSGYDGRIGVFEAIRIDDTIRKLINDGGDESRIASQAFLKNKSLASAARTMVRQGLTTAEEGIRISRREATIR